VHQVPGLVEQARLQEYGVNIFSYCPTKSSLKKALKKKLITVNGQLASTATIIKGSERIELEIPSSPTREHKLQLPLNIIYEDDYLAVVHKPAGLLISGNKLRTLTHALPFNLHVSPLGDACTPQPAHRLDYKTSGLVLVGKTGECIRKLNNLFEKRSLEKTYVAITIGKMKEAGEIDLPVNGKPALTYYRVVQSVISDRFGQLNLVKLFPETGRQNQLRIHMKSIGNPILGDKKFGIEDLILSGKGLYLHATSLKFSHPFAGASMHIEDPSPKKFQKIFKKLPG